MKIFILSDDPSITTGYGNTTTFLCKGFLRNGWDVYAFSFNTFGVMEEFEYKGIKILPNPYAHIGNQIYGNRELFEKYYKKYKPDAILLHNDFYRFSYLAECSEEIRDKCFFWIPEDQPRVDDWVFEHKKFKHIVYLTKYAYDIHKRFFDSKDQVHFLYQGIDFYNFKEYNKSLLKAEYGLENKFVISTVGKNQPRKMYPQMVKAIGEFFKDKEDVFWVVKASPDDILGHNLEPLIEEYHLQNKVRFDTNDYEDRSILYRQIYQISDVFMLLSGCEGFGMPFVEALYCEIPVIATDAVSNKEIIGPGGLVVDVDRWVNPSGRTDIVYAEASIEDFCKKMDMLYKDWKVGGNLIEEFGTKGKEHAKKYFYSEDINDQWDLFIKSKIGYYRRKIDSLGHNIKSFSIVIVTRNNFNNLLHLLKSIRDNTSKAKYEIIIVNNGSIDETSSLLHNLKDDTVRVIDFLYEKSVTAAVNKALHYIKYDHVLVINDEAIVASDYEVDSPLKFICGGIDSPGEEWYEDLFDFCEEVKIVTDGIRYHKIKEKEIEIQARDSFVFFHKDTLKDIGYFDEQYNYSEALADFLIRGGTYGRDQEGYDPSKRIKVKNSSVTHINIDTIEKLHNKQMELIAQGDEKDPTIHITFHSLFDQGVAGDSGLYPIIDELRKISDVNVYIKDIYQPYKNSIVPDDVSSDKMINVCHWLMWELQKFNVPNKIAMIYMENTKLAPHFKAGVDTCDAIFTFDHFNQLMFQNSGVKIPIHVVPWVPALQYQYHERNADFPFNFLCMGSHDQRKNLIYTIDNFWKVFGGNSNVKLIVKTFDENVIEYCKQKLFENQIEYIHGVMDERDMLELLHRSHCLISPTSGEGCGMHIMESMATGMPVITTKWSGALSFCNDFNSYLIDVEKMVTAYDDPNCGVWAWPDANHFRKLMHHVVNSYEEAIEKGKRASEDVRRVTHKDVAQKIISIIKNTDWSK